MFLDAGGAQAYRDAIIAVRVKTNLANCLVSILAYGAAIFGLSAVQPHFNYSPRRCDIQLLAE